MQLDKAESKKFETPALDVSFDQLYFMLRVKSEKMKGNYFGPINWPTPQAKLSAL